VILHTPPLPGLKHIKLNGKRMAGKTGKLGQPQVFALRGFKFP